MIEDFRRKWEHLSLALLEVSILQVVHEKRHLSSFTISLNEGRPLGQVTLATKIMQLTHHLWLCSQSNFWLHFECCSHIHNLQEDDRLVRGDKYSVHVVSYFSPHIKRTVKASSPPRGRSACWTESLVVRKSSPKMHQPGWTTGPLQAIDLISQLFFQFSWYCLSFLAHAWSSPILCPAKMLKYFKHSVPHPSATLFDPFISSASVQCTFVPLWLLNGPITPLSRTASLPTNVTSHFSHLLTSVRLSHQNVLSFQTPMGSSAPTAAARPGTGTRTPTPEPCIVSLFQAPVLPSYHPRAGRLLSSPAALSGAALIEDERPQFACWPTWLIFMLLQTFESSCCLTAPFSIYCAWNCFHWVFSTFLKPLHHAPHLPSPTILFRRSKRH